MLIPNDHYRQKNMNCSVKYKGVWKMELKDECRDRHVAQW